MDCDMVVLFKSDQIGANNKKEYYKKQFDDAYDKNKELEKKNGQLIVAIDNVTEQSTIAIFDLDESLSDH